jgi:hypothetical protein
MFKESVPTAILEFIEKKLKLVSYVEKRLQWVYCQVTHWQLDLILLFLTLPRDWAVLRLFSLINTD